MADLSELQSSQSVKIAGAASSGIESNFVNSSATGDLYTRDSINTSMISGAISVSTSEIEAKVGGSPLTNRKFITITPINGSIYYGASGVTTSSGTPIPKGRSITFEFTNNVSIYLISSSTVDVRIVEGS